MEKFRIRASEKEMLSTNIIAGVIGSVLLFIFVPVYPFVIIPCIMILILYFTADYLIWKNKGIREIEISDLGCLFLIGKEKKELFLPKEKITGIIIQKKLNRQVVLIMTGSSPSEMPGITLYSGSKMKIASDAFRDNEFKVFIDKLNELRKM